MKATGIIRNVDALGRIVIPMELRRAWKIDAGDPMEMFVDGETLIVKAYKPGCILCGSMENTVQVEGKLICRECIKKAARE